MQDLTSALGCAVNLLHGFADGTTAEEKLHWFIRNLSTRAPMRVLADKDWPGQTSGGRGFVEYLKQHKLGEIVELTTPDNPVHLGSGPVTCWIWRIDFPALAKYARERKIIFSHPRALIAWGGNAADPEKVYLEVANLMERTPKSAKELGWEDPLTNEESKLN